MKKVVIDASVVLKWYLADESHGEKALKLLEGYLNEKIIFLAPDLLYYEVLNGLIIAGRRGRLANGKIDSAFEGFLQLGILLKEPFSYLTRLMQLCQVGSITAYDAAYLALAEGEKAPFITADEKLIKAVGKNAAWLTWLGDLHENQIC